jgi:hypothetical protein
MGGQGRRRSGTPFASGFSAWRATIGAKDRFLRYPVHKRQRLLDTCHAGEQAEPSTHNFVGARQSEACIGNVISASCHHWLKERLPMCQIMVTIVLSAVSIFS